MDHFLLTRFNVAYDDRPPPPDEWLRRRAELFETFTVPSVRSQTSTDFTWLVFCDTRSPVWFRERMAAIEECCVVELERWSTSAAIDAVTARRRGERLVTTRLDNDDAIAPTFIATVQQHADHEGFVNLRKGLQYFEGRAYWRYDPSNAFISRVERSASPTTVFVDQHQLLERHGPITQVRTEHPMWLQVVHGQNLLNELRGVRASPRALDDFRILAPVSETGRTALRLEQLTSTVKLSLRVARSRHRWRWLLRSAARTSG